MSRVTTKQLQAAVNNLARIMGRSSEPWIKQANGQWMSVNGALDLHEGSNVHGRAWSVSEMHGTAGCECTILKATNASGLMDAIQAFITGYEHGVKVGKRLG